MTSKGHGLRNVVKFTITYEMEPGTTYDAKRTRIKKSLRRSIDIDSK
jgi:hypothetical protein